MKKVALFVDMDGTMAVWQTIPHMETLYEEGYFRNLPTIENICKAVNILATDPKYTDKISVFVLSAYLSDSQFAFNEKHEWLDEHMPNIKDLHRYLLPFGSNKAEFLKEEFMLDGLKDNFMLLDDYSANLHDWKKLGGTGVKVLNGINNTHGSWKGDSVNYTDDPSKIAESIGNMATRILEGERGDR